MTGEDRSAMAVFVRAQPALTPAELVSAAADVRLLVGEREVARLRRAEAALEAREVPPPAGGRPVHGRPPDESVEAYILRIGAGLRPFEVVRRARVDDVKISVEDVRRARGVAIVEEDVLARARVDHLGVVRHVVLDRLPHAVTEGAAHVFEPRVDLLEPLRERLGKGEEA